MKKVALVFVVAVLLPSLVLAWLAVRSLRDQQFLLERQQSLLDQRVTDALAQNISDYLAQRQQEFVAQVETLAAAGDARTLAAQFDDRLRQHWPLAEVGFCVTASGKILSPAPNARAEAQMFRLDNSGFLGNREPVEVYSSGNNAIAVGGNVGANSALNYSRSQANQSALVFNNVSANSAAQAPSRQQEQSRLAGQPGAPNAAVPSQNRFGSAPPGQSATSAANNSSSGGGGGFGDQANVSSRNPSGQMARNDSAANTYALVPAAQTALAGKAGSPKQLDAPASVVAKAPPPPVNSGVAADAVVTGTAAQSQQFALNEDSATVSPATGLQQQEKAVYDDAVATKDVADQDQIPSSFNYKSAQARKVSPQSQIYQNVDKSKTETVAEDLQNNLSKAIPAEAEFRQLIGNQTDGMLARFLQNKLKLMFWHRLSAEPDLIFGAQLNLDRVVDGLRGLIQPDSALQNEICVALLDDNAKPVTVSRANFQANWKRPFVATEIGDALPHWEVAAYLVNPAALTQAARTAKLTLGLFIALLVLAIGVGSWLIVSSLNSELRLARQKTDFVSNVSHELKTPLTSIRMFSELLAEGRVADAAKQRSYMNIITAEAGRLTRLINNVLDFSRMERGEKKYNFQPCDLAEVVRSTAETFRPHLEAGGFKFVCELPDTPVPVRGDTDALSQVIVNLLSNAEKYSNTGGPDSLSPRGTSGERAGERGVSKNQKPPLPNPLLPPASGREGENLRKEIILQLAQKQTPLPHAEIRVLDRGVGIPRGSEEKIFEKFYRAHDSLGSGVQGSGLGLTIARQIARAHGGDVAHEPRDGGGSCFVLRLPISTTDKHG